MPRRRASCRARPCRRRAAIHAELLRLARLGDGRTIRPPPVLAALATRVNSTRETVSRTINALERRGLIRRDAKQIVIVSPRALEELAV